MTDQYQGDQQAAPDPAGEAGDDPGYIYLPPRRSRWRRKGVLVLAILALLAGTAAAAGWWVRDKLEPGGPKEPVSFAIPPDSTMSQIATLLEEDGIVADANIFHYYVRFTDPDPFHAGVYEGLTTNQAVWDVVDILEAGPLPPKSDEVIVPEGLWVDEIGERALETFPEMTAEGWENAVNTVRSRYQPEDRPLEGLLFPATYSVAEEDRNDEVLLVEQMVSTFDQVADEIDLPGRTAALSESLGLELSPYEVIIVASMVEAEARVADERPQVARVIYNRLLSDMRLDIDATVVYGLGERTETLTQSDLDTDHPHNTRMHHGMPPTPVAAPGRASLEAALNPAEGDWLYYVLVDEDGSHFFTDDHDEFMRVAQDSRDRGVFQ